MKKILVPMLCVLILQSCSYWKVTELKSQKICTIPSGDETGQVNIQKNENGLLDLTFGVYLDGDSIYMKDNIASRIQVFNREAETEMVIGNVTQADRKNEDIKTSNINFNIIGAMASDSDDNLYVQNRLAASGRYSRSSQGNVELSPSYILYFDSNGKLQYTLGQDGSTAVPFYYIEHLQVDSDDRLFVVGRNADVWSVYRFNKKKRQFSVTLGQPAFTEKEDENTYNGKIENIALFQNGEAFLFSVAYYHGTRFKYRKIMKYSIEKNEIEKTVITTPDPKNELFTVVDNKYVYLWNVDADNIKYVICNMNGEIINNLLIEFSDKDRIFNDIRVNKAGHFYSYHVSGKGIDIVEWK